MITSVNAPWVENAGAAQILVVDDDRTTCFVLRRVLEQDGYRVRIATSGTEAIQACEETEQDLILLDYVLPDIDGAQVCAAIRGQQKHFTTPLLVLTSRNDDASVKAALSAGANDFITKPFLVPVLRQRVSSLLAARKAEKLMRHLAYHDPLTGLPNRAYFYEQLDQLAAKSGVGSTHQHAVLCLDLDKFKMVNDACGHSAGDELLRQLAALLLSRLRQTDILARLGGDEFGALLIDCPRADALAVSEKLRDAVSQFCFFWQGRTFTVGISIGIATLDAQAALPAGALSDADAACYLAKNSGRNCVKMHEPGTDQARRRRTDIHWGERISKALADNRFCLSAQRIMPAAAGQTCHLEILAQMVDVDDQVIGASALTPSAERYNLMPAIDRWVVTNALELLKNRRAWETGMGAYWISISAAAIADPGFAHFVIEQLRRFQVPAHRLCFQITEAAILTDMDRATRFIDLLRQHQVLFAVDDFTAGLSSFRVLPLSAVQFLKLDFASLPNIVSSPLGLALLKAINDVAHALQVNTVLRQLQVADPAPKLCNVGTDFLQGPGISPAELLNSIQLNNFVAAVTP